MKTQKKGVPARNILTFFLTLVMAFAMLQYVVPIPAANAGAVTSFKLYITGKGGADQLVGTWSYDSANKTFKDENGTEAPFVKTFSGADTLRYSGKDNYIAPRMAVCTKGILFSDLKTYLANATEIPLNDNATVKWGMANLGWSYPYSFILNRYYYPSYCIDQTFNDAGKVEVPAVLAILNYNQRNTDKDQGWQTATTLTAINGGNVVPVAVDNDSLEYAFNILAQGADDDRSLRVLLGQNIATIDLNLGQLSLYNAACAGFAPEYLDIAASVTNNDNSAATAAVTFDDGYAKAAAGEQVSFIVSGITPGYEVDTVSVSSDVYGTIDVSKTDGVYSFTMPDSAVTLDVSLKASQTTSCTVTFVSDGAAYTTVSAESGSTVDEPAAPTKEGYTFGGWYADEAWTTPVSFPYTVTGDTTLYAKWTAFNCAYTVTVDGAISGGTVAADPAGGGAGDTITVTVTPDEGKQFVAGSLKYTADSGTTFTEITSTAGVYSFAMPGADIILTATFEDLPSSLTINTREELFAFAAAVNGGDTFEGRTVILGGNIALDEDGLYTTADEYFQDGSPDYSGIFTVPAVSAEAEIWTPIGASTNQFRGAFDGGGYTISGLYTNVTDSYQGLFGYIGPGGSVKDITVSGVVAGVQYVGGIAGYINGGAIENAVNRAVIYASGGAGPGGSGINRIGHVGGIAGMGTGTASAPVSITGCANYGTVTSPNCNQGGRAGGIVGIFDLTGDYAAISGCFNTAGIKAYQYAGGIVGGQFANNVTISACYNTGVVTGTSSGKTYAGGIAGKSCGPVVDCYNSGSVVSTATSGNVPTRFAGIAGETQNSTATITNCYSIGQVSGASTIGTSGNIVGSQAVSPVNCYYLSTAALPGAGDSSTTTARTEEELKAPAMPAALGAAFTYDSNGYNGGYPVLAWQNGSGPGPAAHTITLSFDGAMANVSASADEAEPGETVTITISDLAAGKRVQSVAVIDANSIVYPVTTVTENSSYTFNMGSSAVTATVLFENAGEGGDPYAFTVDPGIDPIWTVQVTSSGLEEDQIAAGSTVTVTVTRMEGAITASLEGIAVRDAGDGTVSAETISTTSGGYNTISGGVYTFTMPESAVTIGLDAAYADLSVYTQAGENGTPALVKTYSREEMIALAGGQTIYYTGYDRYPTAVIGKAAQAVRLTDLLNNAGVSFGEGKTLKLNALDESTRTYAYTALYGEDRYYYPNIAAAENKDAGKASIDAMLVIKGYQKRFIEFEQGQDIDDMACDTLNAYRFVYGQTEAQFNGGTPLIENATVGDFLKYTYAVTIITPEAYAVAVDNAITGGTVTVNPASAAAGDTITVTVTPDSGKQLVAGSLKYNDGAGDIEITATEGVYSFVMPALDVTVTAAFETIPSGSTVWDGSIDVTWYNSTDTVFYIDTPAKLAGLAVIVNGIAPSDAVWTLPAGKIAADFNGTWVEYNYSYGGNKSGWRGIDDFRDKTVKVTADLDMGGIYNETTGIWSGKEYMPIGGQWQLVPNDTTTQVEAPFNGTFDGQGHTICNIYASLSNSNWSESVGLIGRLGNHDADPGAKASNVAVKNVAVKGYIQGDRSIGGIVGKIGQTSGGWTIMNCANYATIVGYQSKGTGGIVGAGWNGGIIENCFNAGNVTNNYNDGTGGISGANEVNIYNCYNIGTVTGIPAAAFAIGHHNGSTYSVVNCYWLTGTAPGGGYSTSGANIQVTEVATLEEMKTAGFLTALNGDDRGWVADTGNINNGYPIPRGWTSDTAIVTSIVKESDPTKLSYVSGQTFDPVGMAIWANYSDSTRERITNYTVSKATALETTDTTITVSGTFGGIPYSYDFTITVEANALAGIAVIGQPSNSLYAIGESFDPTGMRVRATYTNGTTLNLQADQYNISPAALAQTDTYVTISYTDNGVTKTVDQPVTVMASGPPALNGDVYELSTADNMLWYANKVNTGTTAIKGKLMNDIDLSAIAWTPIGNSVWSYTGIFDGNNRTVTLAINVTTNNTGVIGHMTGAVVQDLTVNGSIAGSQAIAGVAGYAGGASLIQNCVNNATVTSSSTIVGGIAGQTDGTAAVSGCTNNGDITGTNQVGGIVGYAQSTNFISNSANTGDITATGATDSAKHSVGGVVGCLYSAGVIDSCYNTGAVSSSLKNVGGVTGNIYNASGKVLNSYNTGSVTSTSALDTANTGGVVGYIRNAAGAVQNTYNAGIITGNGISPYTAGVAGYAAGSANISNNYYLDTTAAIGLGYTTDNTVSKTSVEMKSAAFAALLGEAYILQSDAYPILAWQGTSVPETYSVTVDSGITGGTVTVNPASAAAGDTITVSVTPDEGKRLVADSLKYNDGTTDIEITATGGVYSFVLPAVDVTVTAQFEDITAGDKTPPALTADTTGNTVGQSIDITFNTDADWQAAISGITVNGNSLTTEQYTVTAGVITLDNTVFNGTGSFIVTVKATGYADAAVEQAILNPCYLITPEADQIYDISQNQDGIKMMTVQSGVTGMKYFNVGVTPVRSNNGIETLVFVHLRDGQQDSLNTSRGDFDLIHGAGAGFNVKAGDIVKAYMIDELTNAIDFNPTIFQ